MPIRGPEPWPRALRGQAFWSRVASRARAGSARPQHSARAARLGNGRAPEDCAAEAGPVARLLAATATAQKPRLRELGAGGAHLAQGGVARFCPDWTVERFAPGTSTGGIDGPDRGMRYLEWTHPEIRGTTCVSDLVYLLREGDGPPHLVQDRMVQGIFPRATWARLLAEAGFGPVTVADQSGRDVFQAVAA